VLLDARLVLEKSVAIESVVDITVARYPVQATNAVCENGRLVLSRHIITAKYDKTDL